MPRSKALLSPAEYAVLGLLKGHPSHGYDLQRHLTGRRGLGLVCPVESAMVYAILKSLSGLELINGEWDGSSYPPKAIYSVTDAGDAEFQRWLSRPVGRMREVRLDLMVKLYFLMEGHGADLHLATELIREQLHACEAYAREIEGELEAVEPGTFDAIALGSKLSAASLTGSWLADCLANIEANRKGGT